MDPMPTVALSPDAAAQIAAAVKPDMMGQILGPLGALVLALAVIVWLVKRFERAETRANSREDAMVARMTALEDRQNSAQLQVLQQNAVAYDKMAGSLIDLKDTLERMPCRNYPTPLPRS